MSLSFGSLASTAVSTFKGLAVAAAGTEERPDSTPATPAPPAAAPAPAAPAPVVATPAERSEPKAVKRRLGSVLDAYA